MIRSLHAALVGERAGAARHRDAVALELCRETIKRCRVGDFPAEERNALAAILGDDEPLLAVVHAEGQRAAALVHELHSEELLAEARPVFQRLGAHAHVSESFNRHGVLNPAAEF